MTGQNLEIISQIVQRYENSFRIDWRWGIKMIKHTTKSSTAKVISFKNRNPYSIQLLYM